MTVHPENRPALGIAFLLAGILAISINDLTIKQLSDSYPLHQMILVRAVCGTTFGLIFLQFEGGWASLRVARPGLHLLRGTMLVCANLTFFTALAALSLAEATALFFAAPLFITLLSIPVLGERVGPWRMGAVLVGFAGVLIMQRPWAAQTEVSRWVLLLPVAAAVLYASTQILTRKLGVTARASAMLVYMQLVFLLVSLGFFLVAGDGKFATLSDAPSLQFLLRAWRWPDPEDMWLFGIVGGVSAVVGYCMIQAYRIADAATVAPFEYVGLPLAVFWGWAVLGDLPGLPVWIGIVLIVGSGLFVFLREARLKRTRKPRPVAPRL